MEAHNFTESIARNPPHSCNPAHILRSVPSGRIGGMKFVYLLGSDWRFYNFRGIDGETQIPAARA
jgi:hypothetical protein